MPVVGKEEARQDVRRNGLVEVFGEGLTVDVGAEVLGIGHGSHIGAELATKGGRQVFTALIDVDAIVGDITAILQRGNVPRDEVVA